MHRLLRFLYGIAGLSVLAYTVLSFVFLYVQVPPPSLSPQVLLMVMAALAYIALVTGLVILLRGLFFHSKHHHHLTQEAEDGSVLITERALKNCVRTTLGTHKDVQEGNVKLSIKRRKGIYHYSVKVWLGVREGLNLSEYGDIIRQHIANDLSRLTGKPIARVDILFYDLPSKQSEGDDAQ